MICFFIYALFCYFVITQLAEVVLVGLNNFNEAQSGPFCYCWQERDLIQHNAGPDY